MLCLLLHQALLCVINNFNFCKFLISCSQTHLIYFLIFPSLTAYLITTYSAYYPPIIHYKQLTLYHYQNTLDFFLSLDTNSICNEIGLLTRPAVYSFQSSNFTIHHHPFGSHRKRCLYHKYPTPTHTAALNSMPFNFSSRFQFEQLMISSYRLCPNQHFRQLSSLSYSVKIPLHSQRPTNQ